MHHGARTAASRRSVADVSAAVGDFTFVIHASVGRFYERGFPEPSGGTVHAVYPLVFTPTD